MSEKLMFAMILSSVVCWRIGGAGLKWARRFLWPAMAGSFLILSGVAQGRALACVAGLITVNHLPYGEAFTWAYQEFPLRWPMRSAVLTSLALPSFFLSWHLWALRLALMGGLSSLFFWLSRRHSRFTWLLVECQLGFLQSLTLIIA